MQEPRPPEGVAGRTAVMKIRGDHQARPAQPAEPQTTPDPSTGYVALLLLLGEGGGRGEPGKSWSEGRI